MGTRKDINELVLEYLSVKSLDVVADFRVVVCECAVMEERYSFLDELARRFFNTCHANISPSFEFEVTIASPSRRIRKRLPGYQRPRPAINSDVSCVPRLRKR